MARDVAIVTDSAQRTALRERIDTIEAAYEFFLAYAAQGLESDVGSNVGAEARRFLQRAITAVNELPGLLGAICAAEPGEFSERLAAFGEMLAMDVRHASAALSLVAALPSIGSQVVDNLNASIHLRALLTDLFILDEALSPRAAGPPSEPGA